MKKPTLGGVLMIRNGLEFDYCFREAIDCLQSLCDQVVILDAGSDDGTSEIVRSYEDQSTITVCLSEQEWKKYHGREKISHFQNLAKSFLDTDYYFLLQADEIIHEDSFDIIRSALRINKEGYFVHRINFWETSDTYIYLPESRQPCSTIVLRLAKLKYDSIDDGESIDCDFSSNIFINMITICHYGFVRKREVMKKKIINMQENVFELGLHDPKLDQSDVFDPTLWFCDKDLRSYQETHPKFIQHWIKTRP